MIRRLALLPLLAALLAVPAPAWAYVGPGAGLSAIGSLLALVAALVLAVVGFVWYPVKRVMRRRDAERNDAKRGEARR
jgi:hypothetical protein